MKETHELSTTCHPRLSESAPAPARRSGSTWGTVHLLVRKTGFAFLPSETPRRLRSQCQRNPRRCHLGMGAHWHHRLRKTEAKVWSYRDLPCGSVTKTRSSEALSSGREAPEALGGKAVRIVLPGRGAGIDFLRMAKRLFSPDFEKRGSLASALLAALAPRGFACTDFARLALRAWHRSAENRGLKPKLAKQSFRSLPPFCRPRRVFRRLLFRRTGGHH